MGRDKKLKVYCETSFWSYLNGGRTPLPHIAVKQAATLQWWQEIAPKCEVYVSQHVDDEIADGNACWRGGVSLPYNRDTAGVSRQKGGVWL